MRSWKRVHRAASSSDSDQEQESAKQLIAVHSHLLPLFVNLQGLNAPADQVRANWMARGQIQGLEVVAQKMVLRLRPLKAISEGLYQYWTTNPLLQIQLFSAYLCEYVVDIFSIAPEGPPGPSPKDGGEILTIQVDPDKDHTQQGLSSLTP